MRERAQRESETEAVEVEQTAEVEESHDRYVGGEIPPVHDDSTEAARSMSASELAYDDDANTKELKDKVAELVKRNFDNDYKKAFDHYDTDKDGGVEKSELMKLLGDADVGNFLTRNAWANKIIEKLDKGAAMDGKIQWAEFETVFIAQA